MCAISDCDIGCDVEQITNIDMEIARRFFFSEENEALRYRSWNYLQKFHIQVQSDRYEQRLIAT